MLDNYPLHDKIVQLQTKVAALEAALIKIRDHQSPYLGLTDYTKLMKRAKAWMSNHDNPNIAIYHTKNTCEIVRDLTAANSDKSQLLASFRKDNEKLQAKIDALEADTETLWRALDYYGVDVDEVIEDFPSLTASLLGDKEDADVL